MPFSLKHDTQLIYAVPANAMLESNLNIPLRGAAIGNGWIDPRRQYPAYLDYMVKVGILEENSEVSAYWFISQGHPLRRSTALENGQKICRQMHGGYLKVQL